MKPLHYWIIALLPYEIGFLYVIFSDATITQALGLGTLAYPLIAFVIAIFRSPFVFLLSLLFIS